MTKVVRPLISRYNVSKNVWETGYYQGNRFIIVNTVKAIETVN